MQIFGSLSTTTQNYHHQHNHCIAILWSFNDVQQCVIECQKHSQVKFLRTKYNKVRILKYIKYYLPCLLFWTSQPTGLLQQQRQKILYVRFNESFWLPDKCGKRGKTHGKHRKICGKHGKFRRKLQILKFFSDAVRCRWSPCGCNALWMSISKRGRVVDADADYLATSSLGTRGNTLIRFIGGIGDGCLRI